MSHTPVDPLPPEIICCNPRRLERVKSLPMRIMAYRCLFFISLTLLSGCAARTLFGPLPDREGEAQVPGLGDKVTVTWDPRGIPTIEASSFPDALRAQGFLHARLRPLQVEFRRRAVRAELAAAGGPGLLAIDKETLATGMREQARKEAETLPAETRRLIEAYLEGLNAGMAAVAADKPLIWRLAKSTPSSWDLIDILTFARRFAAELSSAAAAEQARWDLLIRAPQPEVFRLWEAAMGEPFPPLPPATADLARQALMVRPARAPASVAGLEVPVVEASNAWALGRSRSRPGEAWLVGDPHLSHDLPSIWMEVRMRWPGGRLSGASLAGAPSVIIGHNAKVAWSFTAAGFDDADLFLVEVDDVENPARYRENGTWKDFTKERHRIAVHDAPFVEFVVRRAGNADYQGPSGAKGFGFLRRWASMEAGGFAAGILQIGRAENVEEVRQAGRLIPGPGQNLLAADHRGSIVHTLVGCYPFRRAEGWDGRVPLVWAGEETWNGCLDRALLPSVIDPPLGLTLSANEAGLAAKPLDAGHLALTGDFDRPFRADRIRQVLEGIQEADEEGMRGLLNDSASLLAGEVQELLQSCPRSTGPGVAAYLSWNGVAAGPGATLLHAAFQGELAAFARYRSRAGRAELNVFTGSRPFLRLLRAARRDPAIARWIDDPETPQSEDPCGVLVEALERAHAAITAAAGPDPRKWDWGRWHQLSLLSPLGAGPLARVTNPEPVPLNGLRETVLAQAFRVPPGPFSGKPYQVVHGPSYRLIVHFSPGGRVQSQSILAGGQDEHPGSPHAFDQLTDYGQGRLLPLDPPASSLHNRLILQPVK